MLLILLIISVLINIFFIFVYFKVRLGRGHTHFQYQRGATALRNYYRFHLHIYRIKPSSPKIKQLESHIERLESLLKESNGKQKVVTKTKIVKEEGLKLEDIIKGATKKDKAQEIYNKQEELDKREFQIGLTEHKLEQDRKLNEMTLQFTQMINEMKLQFGQETLRVDQNIMRTVQALEMLKAEVSTYQAGAERILTESKLNVDVAKHVYSKMDDLYKSYQHKSMMVQQSLSLHESKTRQSIQKITDLIDNAVKKHHLQMMSKNIDLKRKDRKLEKSQETIENLHGYIDELINRLNS